MIVDFLIVGGVLFWALLLLVSLALLFFEENGRFGASLTLVVSVILALLLFGDLWVYVKANPVISVLFIPVYMSCGIMWSIIRWFILMFKMRCILERMRNKFLCENGILDNKIPDKLSSEWSNVINDCDLFRFYGLSYNDLHKRIIPPKFERNLNAITTWALLWPWSILWTVLGDILINVTKEIIRRLGILFQRLSDWMFTGFEDK